MHNWSEFRVYLVTGKKKESICENEKEKKITTSIIFLICFAHNIRLLVFLLLSRSTSF